ncbi:putative F-box/kelch-repeat protein-like [Capsicum annuum]|uniref:histone-lysine N-methyltransferase ASHH2 n=1 Tax=Capsicum annuum TaxID=4072 RepID=UPI0007BEE41E|nr:histone-lysine N-methyltransferase ASHH2 [Capsicum annuum]KAF3651527.1 putative F-box/kelch-repeat protein-like [Capsicum annuum]KAF3679771.1 putative F-box/kelch-repeat protein-like [Capsicum annuum]
MVQAVEHNGVLEIAQSEHKKSKTTKKSKGDGRQGKNHTGQNSQKSKGKSSIPTGPISLKVKFGSRSLMDVVPLIDDHINKQSTSGEESKESPNVTRNFDDGLEAELPSLQFPRHNGNLDNVFVSVSDIRQSGKNIGHDPVDKILNFHHGSPSQEGTSVNNRCTDSGTSPDSEVINLVPDTQINEGDPEELSDLILCRSSVAPGNVPSLRVYDRSKKGRKKDRLPQFASSDSKDLLSSDTMSNFQIFGQLIQGEKVQEGSCYADTSALTIGRIGSGNISCTEIISGELLPCSGMADFNISCAASKLGSGIEGNVGSIVGTESPETELSEKVVSCQDGQIVSKCERSNFSGKGRSQVPDTKSSKSRGSASKKKGNKEKQDNKREVKHENGQVESLSEVKHHPGTENEAPYGFGEVGSRNKTLSGGISDLDIMRNEVSRPSLQPRNAWVQCDDCQKWRRIASVLADQIEETNCKWTCKDNLDRDVADCSIAQEKSNSEINAELEISDASGEEDALGRRLNSNQAGQKKALVPDQSSWTLIKKNSFLHRSRKSQPIDEIMVCHCKPSDRRMGCGDGCLNRMLNVECVRGTCPCGERCSNQQFQKRNYAKLKCFKCGKKGYGLQLLEDVTQGQFLIEYVGEVLDLHAYEARQKEYALKGHKHFYFMTLNGSEVIDACAKGNLGRFINHSCDPNCCTEKWMVNGEVCVGLFALRDIKKGEEVTFDYNYVRVFGAAAKKCVCGSPSCRGYIGGDLLNEEVIVQADSDDDYPEPIVFCEDGDMDDELNKILSVRSSFDVTEIRSQGETPKNKYKLGEPFTGNLENTSQTPTGNIMEQENVSKDNSVVAFNMKIKDESNKIHNESPSFLKKLESSEAMKGLEGLLHSSVRPVGNSFQSEDVTTKTISEVKSECLDADKVSSALPSPNAMLSKSLTKKSGNGGASDELSKSSRRSSSVKKGKLKDSTVNLISVPDVNNKLQIPQPKLKKPTHDSTNGRFEAVEVKLNELLDHDGGISKRRDASRCYLKLLLLTAASGDSCNGEAIQSNRDLSMILDALLKTKSRTVLVDIINKNGLQMLHNIMKRYRREFNKIPILRKLLKVLEYLAVREILSHEHINGGPSRPGVESFRDSILRLTDHTNKQVHQIARNFRDRWIRKPLRKRSCIDRDDSQIDVHPCPQSNRCSPLQDHCGVKPSETEECTWHLMGESTTTDAGVRDGSSTSCVVGAPNRERKRKRKSRWDQEAKLNLDQRIETNAADDRKQDIDDVPPGFSVPMKVPRISCSASSSADCSLQEPSYKKHPHPMVTGHLQQKFISRLPVSYGIPLSKVLQFGSPQKERRDAWDVAPGVPFHPFPPLPTYPCDRRDLISCADKAGIFHEPPQNPGQDRHSCSPGHPAQNPPCLSGSSLPQVSVNTQFDVERVRGCHNLGNKYFRQQKCINSEKPSWHRGRSSWGCTGNNSKDSMCSVDVASRKDESRSFPIDRMENLGHTFQQNHSQQT